MRVLFTVFGSRPHLYPLVPLAWACRAAGHEVRLASTPKFAGDLEHTGLPAVAVGASPRVSTEDRQRLAATVYSQRPWAVDWSDHLELLDAQQLSYLRAVGEYLVAVADGMVDDLVAFGRVWRPEVIVYDAFSYAGAVAAAALDVPSARHLCGTDSVQRLEFDLPSTRPLPGYADLFARFGVPVRAEATVDIDPTPPAMRLAVLARHLDLRYVPHNGPGAQPPGLGGERRRPRVLVTWGSTASDAMGGEAADPYRRVIDAVAGLGVEVVIAAGAEQVRRLGPLPEASRHLDSVPLHLVLPYCDAIVHQGGDGTTLTSAAVGLPQLVIAGNPEEDLTGGRLAAAGAGIQLWRQDLLLDPASGDAVGDAVNRLLSEPTYAGAAARLRAQIEAMPSPAEVVPVLASLTAAADR